MDKSGINALDRIKKSLNKRIYIKTTDFRMFKGSFKCFDSDKNILLSDAMEIHIDEEDRFLGSIVIPGNRLLEAGIRTDEYI